MFPAQVLRETLTPKCQGRPCSKSQNRPCSHVDFTKVLLEDFLLKLAPIKTAGGKLKRVRLSLAVAGTPVTGQARLPFVNSVPRVDVLPFTRPTHLFHGVPLWLWRNSPCCFWSLAPPAIPSEERLTRPSEACRRTGTLLREKTTTRRDDNDNEWGRRSTCHSFVRFASRLHVCPRCSLAKCWEGGREMRAGEAVWTSTALRCQCVPKPVS